MDKVQQHIRKVRCAVDNYPESYVALYDGSPESDAYHAVEDNKVTWLQQSIDMLEQQRREIGRNRVKIQNLQDEIKILKNLIKSIDSENDQKLAEKDASLEQQQREIERLKDAANQYYFVADSFRQILRVGTNDDDGIAQARQVIADKNGEIERLRSALKDLPEQIMQIDRFADTEELTFPILDATEDEQNEWFSAYCEAHREYIECLVEEALSPKEDQTPPTGEVSTDVQDKA